MDKWSETEIAREQEETKRLHMELEANKRLDTFDFVITLVVLGVVLVLAWALYHGNDQIVTHRWRRSPVCSAATGSGATRWPSKKLNEVVQRHD